MPKTGPVSVRLPAAEREAADRLAASLGVTRSVLVRAALTELAVRDLGAIRERVATLPTTREALRAAA